MILDILGEGHNETLLDVGTADGKMAINFVNQGWIVTGIEPDREDQIRASDLGLTVHHMGFEQAVLHLTEKFDAIVFADVLEHFSDPWFQLSSAVKLCHSGSRVIISIPNIAHVVPRLKLATGKFDYEDRGIMDRTHLRFFTKKTVLELISQSGFQCETLKCTPTPIELLYPKLSSTQWGQSLLALNSRLSKLSPALLGYQFLAVCRLPN
jgi:2-polyprenyl-3-methyl-5-hydroxy-6-metoxy-1,4-benzoquinol methylase